MLVLSLAVVQGSSNRTKMGRTRSVALPSYAILDENAQPLITSNGKVGFVSSVTGGTLSSFGLDASGNREGMTVAGVTTNYGVNALNQYSSVGNLTPTYEKGCLKTYNGWTYTYDAMNNLRKVEQGNQLRYFGYDSLSRVIFVRQVEQTVNASLPAWTDPVTSYAGGWTAAFTYDNNGNTLTRTDARNITATFTYDHHWK